MHTHGSRLGYPELAHNKLKSLHENCRTPDSPLPRVFTLSFGDNKAVHTTTRRHSHTHWSDECSRLVEPQVDSNRRFTGQFTHWTVIERAHQCARLSRSAFATPRNTASPRPRPSVVIRTLGASHRGCRHVTRATRNPVQICAGPLARPALTAVVVAPLVTLWAARRWPRQRGH